MTVPLKFGILDLFPKFTAHTLVVLGDLSATGAVTAFFLQAFFDETYDLLVVIEFDLHLLPPIPKERRNTARSFFVCFSVFIGRLSYPLLLF